MNRPQNVIWITTDHMRFDFIKAHGASWMHTPNLDRLINNGATFERCYANNPLCMPSRCSFMSGCYPQQTGVMRNGQELSPDFKPTVGHCFKNGGYSTTQIGKLHFQNHQDHDLDARARHDYGFENLWLSEEPGCYEDAYMTWLRTAAPEMVESFRLPRPASYERHEERRQFQVIDAPVLYSHSGWVADQTIRYLYSWGKINTPQFIHMGFYAPHPPLNPTREMFEPYKGVEIPLHIMREGSRAPSDLSDEELLEYKRHFSAMITGVDIAIGQLLDKLEEQGELDNTLIVFGSDHGDLCGDHGGISKGTNYYEGVMRLPCIMHWPKGIKAGHRHQGLMEMVDVLPTMLDLCGIAHPEAMQGQSFADYLRNGDTASGREDVYAIHQPGQLMLRSNEWKYIRIDLGKEHVREVLYNLIDDPNEERDLSEDAAHNDVLQQQRNRALTRSLHASASIKSVRNRF